MALFSLAIVGSLLYAGLKSYQQLPHPQKSGEMLNASDKIPSSPHPVVALVSKADQACQRFIQQQIDPLLTGVTRQTQLAQLRDDTSTLSAPNEWEQK
ncbi:MAG: hypothetical protein HC877_02395 [Thioploca sp.]|nr:hypothetical protein [Thioploca sp.]